MAFSLGELSPTTATVDAACELLQFESDEESETTSDNQPAQLNSQIVEQCSQCHNVHIVGDPHDDFTVCTCTLHLQRADEELAAESKTLYARQGSSTAAGAPRAGLMQIPRAQMFSYQQSLHMPVETQQEESDRRIQEAVASAG